MPPLNAQEDDPSFKNADAGIIEKIEVYGVHRRLSSYGALKDNIAKTEYSLTSSLKMLLAFEFLTSVQCAVPSV
jgi:hypothetical protein